MTRPASVTPTLALLLALLFGALGQGHSPVAAQTRPPASPPASTPAAPALDAAADTDPRIVALVGSISEQRLRQLLEKLVTFGTRNTLSSTDSTTRGIGAARQWILDEMTRSSKRLQVNFDTHQIPQGGRITRPVELRNIVAILPGKSPRRIYISGHYDSLNLNQTRGGGQQRTGTTESGAAATNAGAASAGRPNTNAGGGTSTASSGATAGTPSAAAQPPSGSGATRTPSATTPPSSGSGTTRTPSAAAQPPSGSGAARAASSDDQPATGAGPAANLPPPNYDIDAPGANDDGSGTVLTMELARVFAESGIEFDATLVFVAFAGEEQGLVGARALAEQAQKNNLPIQAVLNNDIVGNATAGNGIVDSQSVKVYSEGPEDSPSRAIARYVVRTAARYVPSHRVRPMSRHDRFGRGGDHSGFNQFGFAGVVFREARENYSMQHNANDTLDGVSFPYLLQNARVNAAVAASMALAPPPPMLASDRGTPTLTRQPTGYDATLRWRTSPGAVAYRIFWREAWTPDWEHEMTVGAVNEYVMPNVSIDDVVFGVAAIGPGGHESPVAAYVYAQRRY